jgi:tetratricopeptide (TPR) repeat protein
MPEGILGGILGDDEERPELEELESEPSADAFAATIAHHAAQADPLVAEKAAAFLNSQKQMVDVQTHHLEVEHPLRLSHLKNQLREERLRRFGMRLRVSFQIIIVLFAVGIFIGAALMVRDAVSSRSVVIDPFDTPPSMAQSGINGKTVAAGLLDVLSKIQAVTRTDAERRSLSNAWTNEIAIEVPETGVNIAQLERALQTRFGHDQHIVGDLVQTANGSLTLTVRGNDIQPKSFSGASTDLDKLLTQAGEYVYSQSQPGLWVSYLSNNGRPDEAIQFAQSVYSKLPPRDKPYVLNNWANAITAKGGGAATMREVLPLYREAIRLKPDYWAGYNNVMFALNGIGDEEGTVHAGEQLLAVAGKRPGPVPENNYANYDQEVWDLPAERADTVTDMELNGGVGSIGTTAGPENLIVAQVEALMHDPDAAELRVKTTQVDPKSMPDVADAAIDRALIAEARGDIKTAAEEWDKFAVAYADPVVSTGNPPYICYAAVSYQKTGQSAKADAALNIVQPPTYVDCYRFRADVLDLRGNWPEAQQWYAKAIKLAPSIPSSYYSWGMALMRHGNLSGAAVQFATANLKGPHWADPLKAWGDVLIKQGKPKEALAKYNLALQYAPNWKELKEAITAISKK